MILCIALLGCWGAHSHSKYVLYPYASIVLLSVVAQLVLAGMMYHSHMSFVSIAANGYKNQEEGLNWIQMKFDQVYTRCEPTHTSRDQDVATLTCGNSNYQWFELFTARFCTISRSDLKPSSDFLVVRYLHEYVNMNTNM